MFLAPIVAGISSAVAGMGGLGTILSIGGTILGGIQSLTSSSANASAASAEASAIQASGKENARRRRVQAESDTSAQIARFGTSGVDLLGSPLDVIMADASKGELAARDIEQQAKGAAAAKQYEAAMYRYKSSFILPSTAINIGGSLVNGYGGRNTLFGQPLGA